MMRKLISSILTSAFVLVFSTVHAENSVVVESRNFSLGQSPCTIGVFLSNDVAISGIVMPLEARSTVGNAYFVPEGTSHILFSNPGGRLDVSPLGSADPAGRWPAASITKSKMPTPQAVNTCGGPGNGYSTSGSAFDGSPDGFMYAVASSGDPNPPSNHQLYLQPGSDPASRESASWLIIFTANLNPPGCFVIDTVCRTPSGHLDFVDSNTTSVVPSFTLGTICLETDPDTNYAPVIDCPPLIWSPKDPGQEGASVNYTVTVNDEDSTLVPDCNPPSGAFFPLGMTNATCIATDPHGLADTCSFDVHVIDADENSVTVESKTFLPGQMGCSVGVFLENVEPVAGIVLVLELRSISNGAFYNGPVGAPFFNIQPGSRLDLSPLGSADPGGAWPAAQQTRSRFDTAQTINTCTGPISRSWSHAQSTVGGTSPDAVMFASVAGGEPGTHALSLVPGTDPPQTSGASWVFAFDANTAIGCFEIDTACRTPSGHLAFVSEATTEIVPNFIKGTVCINDCICDCHGNPAVCSDQSRNVLDVVYVTNVAFRGTPEINDPNPNCSSQCTDLDCNGTTTVIDLIKMIDVAFRSADPAATFCDPCP